MSNAMILYAHHTDGEIIEKVKMGQFACFEVLVRRHNPALYRIGRMFGLGKDDVQELMYEIHCNTFQNIRRIRHSPSYRAWLTSIMIHKCRVRQRAASPHTETGGKTALAATYPSTAALRSRAHYSHRLQGIPAIPSRLETQVESLPANMRSIFVLHEIEGYTIPETARFLNTTEQNVRAAMGQVKARLRKTSRNWHYDTDVYVLDAGINEQVIVRVLNHISIKPANRAQQRVPGN